jgi:hypothetical protein
MHASDGALNYRARPLPAAILTSLLALVGTFQRSAVCCLVTALALAGVTSCAHVPVISAGQCAPLYELWVDFRPGTSPAAAEKILKSCAAHNPVVIRIGTLRDLSAPRGWSRVLIYTHVFGQTARTAGLLRCLRSSGRAIAAWPD